MTEPSARPNAATAGEAERAAPAAPVTQPAADVDPMVKLVRESAELKDKLLRALAEMENLRRRTEKEVLDARLYGIAAFARDVLGVADNMHRALDALDAGLRETADTGVKALLDGVELTERELLKTLEKNGVRKFEPNGEKFDPNLHQAMYEVPDTSLPPGTIAKVVQAGYLIGDRILRPALVAIAKGGPKPEPSAPSANDNSGAAS